MQARPRSVATDARPRPTALKACTIPERCGAYFSRGYMSSVLITVCFMYSDSSRLQGERGVWVRRICRLPSWDLRTASRAPLVFLPLAPGGLHKEDPNDGTISRGASRARGESNDSTNETTESVGVGSERPPTEVSAHNAQAANGERPTGELSPQRSGESEGRIHSERGVGNERAGSAERSEEESPVPAERGRSAEPGPESQSQPRPGQFDNDSRRGEEVTRNAKTYSIHTSRWRYEEIFFSVVVVSGVGFRRL